MEKLWNAGDVVAVRGISNGRLRAAKAVIVVQDTEKESILLLTPGAQCFYPEERSRQKKANDSQEVHWRDIKNNAWTLRETKWETNRVLMCVESEKYFGIAHFWNHSSNEFSCYYVNFQLPYRRSHCGFDSLDLELDIVIDPKLEWKLKDEQSYYQGIKEGCILENWADEIERAKQEVLSKISRRDYPFDGTWVDWRPSSEWKLPCLPEQWSKL